MPSFIPYGHQYIDSQDIKYVNKVLKSDFITQGPYIKKFEDALCEYTQAKYAVVVSNGTAGLHLACMAMDIIKKNSLVIVPAISFVATSNCLLYKDAKPVFCDVDKDTVNISVECLKKLLNSKIKAVICVDFAGLPCDYEKIYALVKKTNTVIIQDACHSLGAVYKGSKVGSCKYSLVTVFSFHPVKSITTGEGGAVLTNDRILYKRIQMLRNHGMYKYRNSWYYQVRMLGFNYRMTDIQASLGLSQLQKLDKFVRRREEIVKIYNEEFKELKDYVELPRFYKDKKSSWHLYVVKLKGKFKNKRRHIFNFLRNRGIGVGVHYIPIYWHPLYQRMGYKKGLCPQAEDYYCRCLTLPLYPSMKDSQIKRVIKVFKDAFQK